MRKKTEERRQAILKSAVSVFWKAGYERASMSDIAQQLGCSKVTLYSYFTSKEELFYEAMLEATEAKFAALHATLQPQDDDVRGTLERFGVNAMEIVQSPQVSGVRRLLIAEAGKQDSNIAKRCYELGPARTNAVVAAYLQQLMSAGKLRCADPMVASLHLRALLEAEWLDAYLYGTLETVSNKQRKEAVERAVDTFLRGFAVQKQ